MDVYSIKFDGQEIALITGDGITCGKKVVQVHDKWEGEQVDDPKMLRITRDGLAVVVFYVSSSVRASVEKISG